MDIAFRIANVAEDAIPGMAFFAEQKCHLALDQGILSLGGQQLQCTDKTGGLISTKVQILRETLVPAATELQLNCRLIGHPSERTGVIEHHHEDDLGVRIAHTLTHVQTNGNVTVRCINPHSSPVTLRAGTTIGLFSAIQEDQIFAGSSSDTVHRTPDETSSSPLLGLAGPGRGRKPLPGASASREGRPGFAPGQAGVKDRPTLQQAQTPPSGTCIDVPPHLQDLFNQAQPNCQDLGQQALLLGADG